MKAAETEELEGEGKAIFYLDGAGWGPAKWYVPVLSPGTFGNRVSVDIIKLRILRGGHPRLSGQALQPRASVPMREKTKADSGEGRVQLEAEFGAGSHEPGNFRSPQKLEEARKGSPWSPWREWPC